MQAVQSIERTEKKAHDAGLASYLDKLLCSEIAPPESVSSAAADEHHSAVVSTDRAEGSSPEDSGPTVWAAEQKTVPVPQTHTEWPKTNAAPRRPKRATRRKVKTKVRHSKRKQRNGRQIVMTVLIPVLAVTLVVLLRKPSETPAPAAAVVLDTALAAPAAVGEVEIDWEIPPVYQPEGRDPMKLTPGPVQPEEPTPQTRVEVGERMDIKGLLHSDDGSTAIIGTRLLHEGDQIAGITVVRIERDGVEFEKNGQRWKQTVSTTMDSPDQDTRQSVENGS